MRNLELDAILGAMLQSYDGISDINFSVGRPLQVEAYGVLRTIQVDPPIESLTAYQTEQIALNIVRGSRRLLTDLVTHGSCDTSYFIEGARFRVNIFRQRGQIAIVMRKLQSEIPTITALSLPSIFEELAKEKNGLVLVTGATGNGKTTTLAAVLDRINEMSPVHIITLEDPIEYVHTHKLATFNQRELGNDFDSYSNGLRAALRQAPKVILVGEMRDRATVEIALTAAETGHLVLSTVHTINAGQTINRILGLFDNEEEDQIRQRLAETLRYIVSQRLVAHAKGGRHLLLEIMGSSLRTREAVALGETEGRTFYNIIADSETFGWRTFDQSIIESYRNGDITEETAALYATRKGVVVQQIDLMKKTMGGMEKNSGLKLDIASTSRRESAR